jgi:transposase
MRPRVKSNVPYMRAYSLDLRQKVIAAVGRGDPTIEEVAAARGARVLWLALYAPDFSPIEQCWSKLKACLLAAKARTREEIEKALAQSTRLPITKSDIRGWFKHCGYSLAHE